MASGVIIILELAFQLQLLQQFTKKDEFVERLKFFIENRTELSRIGNNANKFVLDNFLITEQVVSIIDDIYTLNYETENEDEQ